MFVTRDSLARGLDPHELNRSILQERGEDAHRVRPAADTRHDRARQPADLFQHLGPRLTADHRLEVPHQTGKWIWPDD